MTWPVGHGLLVQTLAQDGLTSDFLSPPCRLHKFPTVTWLIITKISSSEGLWPRALRAALSSLTSG